MSDCRTDVYVNEVLMVLKSTKADNADLRGALRRFAVHMDDDIILMVLQKQRSNWAYTEMLDILGRMKKVRHMRQLFDEIPEERGYQMVVSSVLLVGYFKLIENILEKHNLYPSFFRSADDCIFMYEGLPIPVFFSYVGMHMTEDD
ncbi:hypothetical protein ZEAMMB73_Zm00001d050441 [Zea mays]|uniref:Uncharacterized protein n=1 Tax=Zea mays TaxID=4577 RepID=A0A1D6Q1P7_MAIZE|nr:hypothetical protein ZEAMMB73_Zm00001d050441 [Zea mays]